MATIARMIGTIGIVRRKPSRPKPGRRARAAPGRIVRQVARELGQLAHGLRGKALVQALLKFVLVEPAVGVVLAQPVGGSLAVGVARA